MARTHARILTSIWQDPDFLALSGPAQHLYMLLVSQPALSYAGTLTWIPDRYATLTRGGTATRVLGAWRDLEKTKFTVTDVKTHELLIRSYVRHDGVLDRVNMGKACGAAVNAILSAKLRRIVAGELGRLYSDKPGLPGWAGLKEASPITFDIASAMQSDVELPMG